MAEPTTVAALGLPLAQEGIRHVDLLQDRAASNNEVGLVRDGTGFRVSVTDERGVMRYSEHHDGEADACRDLLACARMNHEDLEALRKAGRACPQG